MELVGAIEAHATLGVAPMTSILHDVAFDDARRVDRRARRRDRADGAAVAPVRRVRSKTSCSARATRCCATAP